MTRNEWRDYCGRCMVEKGHHDDGSGFVDGALWRIALVLTEVAETTQEFKRHWNGDVGSDVRDRIAAECADTAIRLYDLAYWLGSDLDQECPVERVPSCGVTERFSFLIRCGKIAEFVTGSYSTLFDLTGNRRGDARAVYRDENYGLEAMAVGDIISALVHLEDLCRSVGRDMTDAVTKKMAENMARPHKYGTPDASVAKADQFCSIEQNDFVAAVRGDGCSFDACDSEGCGDPHAVQHGGDEGGVHESAGGVDTDAPAGD